MRAALLSLATLAASACSPGSGAHGSEHPDAILSARDTQPQARAGVAALPDTVPSGPVGVVDSTGEPPFAAPTAGNLTGAWVGGTAMEPSLRYFVRRQQCDYSPGFWALEQRGDTVRAYTVPPSRAQGIATRVRPVITALEGKMKRGVLTLGDAATGYRLRFDSASGHLRGTFNGAPFWAVPLQIVRPSGCREVP